MISTVQTPIQWMRPFEMTPHYFTGETVLEHMNKG